jgi:Asp/Glu/hydantoin racemase
VVATVGTTIDPTSKLIERKAAEAGKSVVIRSYLAEGAFDALMNGNPSEHDRLLLECIVRAASENEVVALAQGSMARLVPMLAGRISVPVLASPRLGVEALRDALSRT